MAARKYLISISNIEGKKLPKKDLLTKSDTYCIIYWPNTKPIRTDVVLKSSDPKWIGFEHSLEYILGEDFTDSESIRRFLLQQSLRIECYAKHSLRKDSLVGQAKINLLLCLGGPTKHRITLLDDRKQQAGKIYFTINSQCIGKASISFHDVVCNLTESQKPKHLFLSSFISSNNNEIITPICFNTCNPYWAMVGPFDIEGDIQMIMNSKITLRLLSQDEDVARVIAVSEISLGKYNTASEEYIFFKESINEEFDQTHNPIGHIEGYLSFSNLPVPCQMWGGYHEDNKIYNAAPITTGLYTFPDKNVDKLLPVYDLYRSGELVEKDRGGLNEESQNQLRGIIERINCEENTTEALHELIDKFEKNKNNLKEAFYQVGGVSIMISLLQNSLDLLPINDSDNSNEILPLIAKILYLGLEDYQKNQAFLCRSYKMNLLFRFLEQNNDTKAILYILKIVTMISMRDYHGQKKVIESGGVAIISQLLLHEQNEDIIITCLQLLGSMVFGIDKSNEDICFLLRNTGSILKMIDFIDMNIWSIEIKFTTLSSIRIITNNNPSMQRECFNLLLSKQVKWDKNINNILWIDILELLILWKKKIDINITINQDILENLINIISNYELSSKILELQEQLLFLILEKSECDIDLSFIDITKFSDIKLGIQILFKISQIQPQQNILSKNYIHILKYSEISLNDVIDLLLIFGKGNIESLPLLFSIYYQLLIKISNNNEKEDSLNIIIESIYNILLYNDKYINAAACNDLFQLSECLCDIYFSDNYQNNNININSYKCLCILLENSECIPILLPNIKLILCSNSLVKAINACKLLKHAITINSNVISDISSSILRSLETYFPSQLSNNNENEDNRNELEYNYIDIISILASKDIIFRKTLLILLPNICILNNISNNEQMFLFPYKIIINFANTFDKMDLELGISIGCIYKLLDNIISKKSEKITNIMNIFLNICITHFTDIISPCCSYLQSNWDSIQYHTKLYIFKETITVIINNNIQIEQLELQRFILFIINNFIISSISNENINNNNNNNDFDEILNELTLFIKYIANNRSWNLIIPCLSDIKELKQLPNIIKYILNVCTESLLELKSEDCLISLNEFLECYGCSNFLLLLSYINEIESLDKLLTLILSYSIDIKQNIFNNKYNISLYEDILKQLLNSDNMNNILLAQSKFILWIMGNISAINIIRQFGQYSLLSLVDKIFSKDIAKSLYSLGLYSFSNILKQVPDILLEIPISFFDMQKMIELLHSDNIEMVPAICRLVLQLLNDPRFQEQFILADGFYQLSKIIEHFSVQLQNSKNAQEIIKESLEILVFSSRISSLQLEILGDGLIPHVLNLLNLTRIDDIIKRVLLFIKNMSIEIKARKELIDSRDIDSLSTIIDQDDTYPELSKLAMECYTSLGGLNILCNAVTSNLFEYQDYYCCRTCGLTEGICINCANVCHKGHGLSTLKSGTIRCTCGTSPNCLIKERPTLRLQVPLRICSFAFTGSNYTEQAWFFCRTCFRNEQKGVCTTCAYVCHEGHDIRFGRESRFFCDCASRYGSTCKCAQHIVVPPSSLSRFRKKRHIKIEEIEEDEESDEDTSCIVCMDQQKDALFYKCGHIAACMDCACMLKQRNDPCVICRKPIEAVVRTFYV